jgi:hypothetical protein
VRKRKNKLRISIGFAGVKLLGDSGAGRQF